MPQVQDMQSSNFRFLPGLFELSGVLECPVIVRGFRQSGSMFFDNLRKTLYIGRTSLEAPSQKK